MACKERGPDTVPDFEEVGGSRQGQGEVGVPYIALFHGQTGYSANVRGGEHQNDQRANKTSNAMTRHNNIYHRSQKVQMSVVSLHNTLLPASLKKCRLGGVEVLSFG